MNKKAFWKYVLEYSQIRLEHQQNRDASFALYLPTGRVLGVISMDTESNTVGGPVVQLHQVNGRPGRNYDDSLHTMLIDVGSVFAIERLGTAHLELSGDFKLDPTGELAHAVRGVVKGYFNPEGPV